METVSNLGELIHVKISRKKSEFGGICKFGDRDSIDGFLEFRPYRDTSTDLLRSELNVGVQAVHEIANASVQTSWYRPLNFQCQYEPITMDPEEQEEHLESEAMDDFIRNISVRLEKAIQQNEILDIFCDDYQALGEDEPILERGHHTMLQEYQSFTDLLNSKSMCITCIDWHPSQKGYILIII